MASDGVAVQANGRIGPGSQVGESGLVSKFEDDINKRRGYGQGNRNTDGVGSDPSTCSFSDMAHDDALELVDAVAVQPTKARLLADVRADDAIQANDWRYYE